jgi:hypothetical protein
MHDLWEPHLAALKRIFHYIRGSWHHSPWSVASTENPPPTISCSVATTRCHGPSTQHGVMVLRSSRRVPSCRQCCCQGHLASKLLELHAPLRCASLVYCDNISVVYVISFYLLLQYMRHLKHLRPAYMLKERSTFANTNFIYHVDQFTPKLIFFEHFLPY